MSIVSSLPMESSMSYACLKRDKIIGVSLKGSMKQVDEFLCDDEDRRSDREKKRIMHD